MAVSAARAAAFDILLRVERESSYASELLHASVYERLARTDHALATELVMGVLRWRSALDEEIARASSQRLSKIDVEVLLALRLGVYQLRFLDRIPPRAAIYESVELVKRARKRSAATFVNAVLRKIAGRVLTTGGTGEHKGDPDRVAARWAHPAWMVERWVQEYGLAAAQKICEHDQATPVTAIRLRTAAAESELRGEGIQLLPGALMASARRVEAGDVTKTRMWRRKDVFIQDEASQLVAALVGSTEEQARILDCCSAPGGKTRAIADRNPEAKITALEVHPHRARLMRKLLGTSENIEVVAGDATNLPVTGRFERILADVPCSGTGTLARNPEIKWRLTAEDLTELHERQVEILQSALGHLKPGGRLVYSTCSLEKEENEDVVARVVEGDKSIRVRDCGEELELLKSEGELVWADRATLTRGPYLRTIPGGHPCDGFFAAVFER